MASLLTRRSLIVGASTTLICAPAVVRHASLMPIHGVIVPVAATIAPAQGNYYGFVNESELEQ